jgi:hypothetical protein
MERINNWRKENPKKRFDQKKREKVRAYLRKIGIFPPSYVDMNDDEMKINEQISNNDFSYWDKIKKDKKFKESEIIKFNKRDTTDFSFWMELNDVKKTKGRLVKRGKKSKKDCNIDITDIEIPEYCPYLNIKLSTDIKDCYNDNYYSIDRIDSSKGYVKGNIQIISRLANTMKNNATIEQLLVFAENIKRLYSKTPL